MKDFRCDKCNKKFIEEEDLFSEDSEVSEQIEGLELPSFSIGELVYNGSEGDLCEKCIRELFTAEMNSLKEKQNDKDEKDETKTKG